MSCASEACLYTSVRGILSRHFQGCQARRERHSPERRETEPWLMLKGYDGPFWDPHSNTLNVTIVRRRERITVFNQLIQHEESIHVQCGYVYDLSWGSYAFRQDVYHHNVAVPHPFACETDTAWCKWLLCKGLNKRFNVILGSVCILNIRGKLTEFLR